MKYIIVWFLVIAAPFFVVLSDSNAQDEQPFIPLADFVEGDTYLGMDGGLYGNNANEIPHFYRSCVMQMSTRIQPLDEVGMPADDGTIGFVSIGHSNTMQIFEVFMADVAPTAGVNPAITFVNGAQSGQDALAWGSSNDERVWSVLDQRLVDADVTHEQVQVIWLKTELRNITRFAETFTDQHQLRIDEHEIIISKLQDRFPNLRMIYLSSRAYGGFVNSKQNSSVTEPLSYESAFAVRYIILNQIAQYRASIDVGTSEAAACNAPILLWGAYIWAGETPRRDGFVYVRDDFMADGYHPSQSGRQKSSELLLDFFSTHPSSVSWFLD